METVKTNVGVPPGDGLSPFLFATHLFHANQKLNESLSRIIEDSLHADEQVFYSCKETLVEDVRANVKDVYQEFNLKVNEEKTEDFQAGETVKTQGTSTNSE